MGATNRNDLIRVLVVEDNRGDALLIEEAFGELGQPFEIVIVSDGEVARDRLLGGEPPIGPIPDLILLDLNLPKMNGHELLKVLKTNESLRRVPTVVLTSSSARRDVAMAYDLHCNAYFCKPSTFDAYVRLIREIVTYWRRAIRPC